MAATLRKMRQNLGNGFDVRIGFSAGARYPDGTPVGLVALWNEFGTKTSPPRPAIRQTIAKKGPGWPLAMARILKNNDYDSRRAAELMGEGIKGQVVKAIMEFDDPPNAPSTIARKGFNKPLIDTSLMVRSIDYEVILEKPDVP